jgi:benzoate/toluate 1,2-dioxygenase beta subunit
MSMAPRRRSKPARPRHRTRSRRAASGRPPATPEAVERFLVDEARLLDERRFDDWLALFTADATYWVPAEPGQADPLETISLIYDDRRLLETRVRRLRHPAIHAQTPPSRTTRLIGNVIVVPAAAGAVAATSTFQMVEYRRDKQRLWAGRAHHVLVPTGTAFRIRAKRVDLVNCDSVLDGISVLF